MSLDSLGVPIAPWSTLCPVDVTALAAWLPAGGWSIVAPTKPSRIFDVPVHLLRPITDAVLTHFPACRPYLPMLSRMLPGVSHPMHVDRQEADWVTRIHVPVVTNPFCWLEFEDVGRIHFQVGHAYTFDALHRHSFGNGGDTERVHLIFDVVR